MMTRGGGCSASAYAYYPPRAITWDAPGASAMLRPMIIELTKLQLWVLHIKLDSSGLNAWIGPVVTVILDLFRPPLDGGYGVSN